jgi:predicted HD phosphohydrolase
MRAWGVSVRSLAAQGGPTAQAEVERFLRHPLAAEAILVRRWDDEAKLAGAPTSALDELLDIAATVAG